MPEKVGPLASASNEQLEICSENRGGIVCEGHCLIMFKSRGSSSSFVPWLMSSHADKLLEAKTFSLQLTRYLEAPKS